MITWPVIIQHKTQGAFLNILNSVEQFLASEHPYNRTVIKIWHWKWFVNDHMTFVVKNPFKTLKNVQLPTGLYAHIWNMLCKIQFVINLHTEYLHSFCGRYCCILNIYHQTINITTMGWNQHCLEFFRIRLQRILFKPVHKNNDVLC